MNNIVESHERCKILQMYYHEIELQNWSLSLSLFIVLLLPVCFVIVTNFAFSFFVYLPHLSSLSPPLSTSVFPPSSQLLRPQYQKSTTAPVLASHLQAEQGRHCLVFFIIVQRTSMLTSLQSQSVQSQSTNVGLHYTVQCPQCAVYESFIYRNF